MLLNHGRGFCSFTGLHTLGATVAKAERVLATMTHSHSPEHARQALPRQSPWQMTAGRILLQPSLSENSPLSLPNLSESALQICWNYFCGHRSANPLHTYSADSGRPRLKQPRPTLNAFSRPTCFTPGRRHAQSKQKVERGRLIGATAQKRQTNTKTGGRNSSVGSAWACCPQRRGFDPPLGAFSVEGIFPLELTWVQTPFPPKLLRMRV